MTEIIIKLFIKNHKAVNDPSVRKKYGTLSSIVGIIVNLVLSGIKILAGVLSGSVAVIADALNNLSDAATSVILFVSFRLSARPADKNHPFGHARLEYVASMIVSFLILLVGVELFISSAEPIIYPERVKITEFNLITIVILISSMLLKMWLGIFYTKIGKKINSSVIKASAMDSLSDSISTFAVLASSIIIKHTGLYIIDSIVGIGVSLLIISAGAKILNDTKNVILGEAPVEETVTAIKNIVNTYPEIIGIHDLIVHNYGPRHFIASFHAEVNEKGDLYTLHDVIDNAERQIKSELGIVCTIHLDPVVTDNEEVLELKEFLLSTMKKNGLDFSIHDFRTVIGNTHTNMIFDIALPFDSNLTESEVCERISSAVSAERENCYCVITVDRE